VGLLGDEEALLVLEGSDKRARPVLLTISFKGVRRTPSVR